MAGIVIVEDNSFIRSTLRTILTVDGHKVVAEARNGKQALERVRSARPDLVCLDIGMDDVDGFEVARRLREAHPKLAIVMVSGSTDPNARSEALAAGADRFVAKPFTAAVLEAAIAEALAGRAQMAAPEPNSKPPLPTTPQPASQPA